MPLINEKRFQEIINEISEECNCHNGYCFFRELIKTMHPDIRLLVQFKMIEKWKWIWSKNEGRDIGLHTAGMKWVEDGYAKKFAEFYNENESVASIHRKILESYN